MTTRPNPTEFLISGNIHVPDVLNSTAKEIDRIMDGTAHGGDMSQERRNNAFRSLARRLRRLAETIAKGE